MSDQKSKPLSKQQLAVVKNLLHRKIEYLVDSISSAKREQFNIDLHRFNVEIEQYNQKYTQRVLNEARRRPSTYILKEGVGHGRVTLDTRALDEWYKKKYGEQPVAPVHPSKSIVAVFFASLNDGYDRGMQVNVPKELRGAVEALSHKLDIAVLNGQAEGIVEAINALGE